MRKSENSLINGASWFESKVGPGKENKPERSDSWLDKDYSFIPINVNRNHWILTVVLRTQGIIYHLDLLGNPTVEDTADCLCNFLNHRSLVETFCTAGQVWKVK